MDLGKYKAVTKPLAVDFDGEVINVEYRPNIYTLGFQRRLEALRDDTGQFAELFLSLVASWDLKDGEAVVPLTAAGLEGVPLMVLAGIQGAVAESMLPTEEEKKGSSEPSALPPPTSTEPSQSSQQNDPTSSNGLATTESPTVSESVQSS